LRLKRRAIRVSSSVKCLHRCYGSALARAALPYTAIPD